MSSESLKRLLLRFPNLECLTLESVELETGEVKDTNGIDLSHLKSLTLDDTDFERELLKQLLQKAVNLNVLTLKFSETTYFDCETLSFPHVTNMELCFVGRPHSIIKKVPSLKHLTLSYIVESDQDENAVPSLSELKTLDFEPSRFSARELQPWLSKNQHLQHINLNCDDTTENQDQWDFSFLGTVDLSQLHTLNFSETTITVKALQQWLSKTPRLQNLDLSQCCELNEAFPDPDTIDLPQLKLLRLADSSMSVDALQQLLSAMPSLRYLDLAWYKHINKILTEDDRLNLPYLRSLNLQGSPVTVEAVQQWLEKAPCLEYLNLSKTGVHFNLLAEPNSVMQHPTLCKIIFEQLDVIERDDFFIHLFKRFPKLTEIFSSGWKSDINNQIARLLWSAKKKSDIDYHRRIIVAFNKVINQAKRVLAKSATQVQIDPFINDYQPQGEKSNLDADTSDTSNTGATYELTRQFWAKKEANHPDPIYYRHRVYNGATSNPLPCDIKDAFRLFQTSEQNIRLDSLIVPSTDSLYDFFQSSVLFEDNERQHFYGKCQILLSAEWVSLPSLSANEIILFCNVIDNASLRIKSPVQLGYSPRDNLYFVRQPENLPNRPYPLTLEFIVQFPIQTPLLANEPKKRQIKELIEFCHQFENQALNITCLNPTGTSYFKAISNQRMGSCRHRSVFFKIEMQFYHPKIPVRIVMNSCHSFIEIQLEGEWKSIDLGGYEATLILHDPLMKPKLKSKQATFLQNTTVKKSPPVLRYFSMHEPLIAEFRSPLKYAKAVVSGASNKCLLYVNDANGLASVAWVLQQYCKNSNRRVFYIDSPNDMVCAAAYLESQPDNTGSIKKGPGGRLHRFLTDAANVSSPPIIIINYDSFTASELIGFNSVLDNPARIDGTNLPTNTKIIALMNPNKPDAYHGADFTSRFNAIETVPAIVQQVVLPALSVKLSDTESAPDAMDLYGEPNWEERLIGHWVLDGDSLQFIEGVLVRALKQTPPASSIQLRNAPTWDPRFKTFWRQVRVSGFIEYNNEQIVFPSNFTLFMRSGYDFSVRKACLSINMGSGAKTKEFTLNPTVLLDFYGAYAVNAMNQTISLTKGILETYQGQTLDVYLSRALGLGEWAKLLDACQIHGVRLNLTLAPKVTLPLELGLMLAEMPAQSLRTAWVPHVLCEDSYVISTDLDVSTLSIQSQNPSCLVIDVSELEPKDLLGKIDGSFSQTDLKFSFKQECGFVLGALDANQNLILKGTFSAALQDKLTAYLLERQQKKPSASGKLILLSEDPGLFSILPSFYHSVSTQEKKDLLYQLFNGEVRLPDEAICEAESFVLLQTRMRYQHMNPQKDSSLAWQGLKSLPPFEASLQIDLDNAAQKTAGFNEQRLYQVTLGLKHSPFIFLAGMTGVGKTTFIHAVWQEKHPQCYFGENQIAQWAMDESEGIKTLFIDEANIASRQWSEFEGLFTNPPSMLLDNQCILLTSQHKVIFAGNPASYGGERQLPELFKRHGNTIVFEPLPAEYLYHELLKPVFEAMGREDLEALASIILAVNQFMLSLQQDKILLSPRELTSMAILTGTYCANNPMQNSREVARYYVYTVARPFVPEAHFDAFERQFKVDALPRPRQSNLGLLINCTNQPACDALQDALDLRDQRIRIHGEGEASLKKINEVLLYGGLGGLLIEGEPGLGKTELVIESLRARGFIKGDINQAAIGEVFYHLPVTTAPSDKRALLLKAFDEGTVVVIDEINSGSMVERLLNDLLMGKSPHGKRPQKPGFTVFGTQNPASLSGRAKASHAIEHRLQKIILSVYTEKEMMDILVHKGLDEITAMAMVDEYSQLREYEKQCPDVKRTHCFRDLLQCTENHLQVEGRQAETVSLRHADNRDRRMPSTQGTSATRFFESRSDFCEPPQNRHRRRSEDDEDNSEISLGQRLRRY